MGKLLLLFCVTVLLTMGCSSHETEQRERKNVDFTVVEEAKLPPELLELIGKNREREIRMTYADGEDLYLIRGYGKQKTGGYSISVVECTEDEEAVYLDTQLIGPQKQDGLSGDPSYPYIVLKAEAREKEVRIE